MERDEKQQHDNDEPLFIREAVVKELLSWNDCVDALESALVAATNSNKSADKPFSSQTPRTFTPVPGKGVLLSMPGFIGNYPLQTVTGNERHSTLACKLVTSFSGNSKLNPPLPSILATILMFNADTGRLKAIVDGTEITAWRTAAVSLVATKHLYYSSRRFNSSNDYTLAICGTGAQGRIHAIGMLTYFPNFFSKLNLWNRTKSRAVKLRDELNKLFPGLTIAVLDNSTDCVNDADVIVTATNSSTPLFGKNDLRKSSVHINAIGAGTNHHSELALDIYQSGSVFIESNLGIQTELKGIEAYVKGEIGEVIKDEQRRDNSEKISVFQSMGNALEDGVMANLIYQKFIRL
ncbi:CLUMA_CG013416, isoform A [Clunio marinus]|uniref:Ketimine reductase mu-crystallin n=1 Tax=Clunio marinus TaxID=568069 RepID=A0A1J1IIU0_9DIPT|nr:CLUMA_CG013416, isoform A [Clunio marinus]